MSALRVPGTLWRSIPPRLRVACACCVLLAATLYLFQDYLDSPDSPADSKYFLGHASRLYALQQANKYGSVQDSLDQSNGAILYRELFYQGKEKSQIKRMNMGSPGNSVSPTVPSPTSTMPKNSRQIPSETSGGNKTSPRLATLLRRSLRPLARKTAQFYHSSTGHRSSSGNQQLQPSGQQPVTLADNGRTQDREIPESALIKNWRTSPFLRFSSDLDIVIGGADVSQKPSGEVVKTFATVFPCDNGAPNCYYDTMYSVDRCPHKCKQITNLTEADAVVFYVFKIRSDEVVPHFRRPRGQRWVMFDTEPPCRKHNHSMLDLPKLKGQFNWTLSYRLDADIPWLYGYLRSQKPPLKDYNAIYRKKSVTAAWFVGHCSTGSQRDVYAKYMQDDGGLDLHIYGACGNYTCQGECEDGTDTCNRARLKRGSDDEKCLPLLSEKYFFYLAFENSLCKDYVTEKFFKIFKNVDTIPVLRGGADHKRLFPPNTFVDAADFASPADLAAHLKQLSRNRWRYTEMLKEKDKYRFEPTGKWFCKLCEKMHSASADRIQWYPNMRAWYVDGQCREPSDLISRSSGSLIRD